MAVSIDVAFGYHYEPERGFARSIHTILIVVVVLEARGYRLLALVQGGALFGDYSRSSPELCERGEGGVVIVELYRRGLLSELSKATN